MENLENNKMIAEFEGYKINYGFKKTGVLMLKQHISEEKLAYHSSWDWLMPVVENCLTLDFMTPDNEYYGKLHDAVWDLNKEEIYKTVVEIIKWHNGKQ